MIVNNNERFNTIKKTKWTFCQCSKYLQTMIIRIFNVRKISHYLIITDPLINQSIDTFSSVFYLVVKTLIITKNSVMEIQKVNHESQHVKSKLDRFLRLLQTRNSIYSPISQKFREMNNLIYMFLLQDESSFTSLV